MKPDTTIPAAPQGGAAADAPAAFFDLDGTLFDTRADLAATVNHTRADLGLPALPLETVVGFVGQGAHYLLTNSIPECAADARDVRLRKSYDDLWGIFRSRYAEHCCETLEPYPGMMQTLEELKRRGWLLGIVTNKPNFATRLILEKFGLSGFFGGVVGGGDCPEMKPSAMPLLACAAQMGHAPAPGDWMVGDSWTDMRCAEAAGVGGAFCRFGFGRLNGAPTTAELDRFCDLLRFANPPE
ncbi:MAG: HAD-IA family hydrolase [Kiritimatiellae bacterium]|nr:HAD-IA family hydrolase [Kiritimatiellia bacterium]